ncbi:MAG TPA: class II aldolase/adducin family protein [Streptosporangiaceae bacterium]|nr:class II aldolase/adducin family protein [Streptosporangiaceae bacterium]
MRLAVWEGDRGVIPGSEATGPRDEVAEAARVLARLGLVTAFGHVSARAGGAMLITPAADLARVTADLVVEVPLGTREGPLPAGAPAEAWAHLALYQARPDAAAIARAQPPDAFAAAAAVSVMVPLHGQAAWLGESVPVHDDATLLRSAEQAERAARCLPDGEALLLRGNGALTLGVTPGLAVARMWLLAAACDVYLKALTASGQTLSGLRPSRAKPITPLSAGEIASWRAVSGELLPRLWEHLRRRPGAGVVQG